MEPHHIYSFDGIAPRIHPRAYVHPSACLIGDVEVGEACFIGPHATLRGDNGRIRLDAGSNVQDNCVLHSRPGGILTLHRLAQVGHGAVLHGCSLMENCMVGIHSTVLDDAVIGPNCMVGAQALVTKGTRLEAGSLYAGIPARFVKALSAETIKALRDSALHYAGLASHYRSRLRRVAHPCLHGTGRAQRGDVAQTALADAHDPCPRFTTEPHSGGLAAKDVMEV